MWTDGACSGNPGPGGWAAIVVWPDGAREELYGGEPHTTNNRMEYTAALEGLRALPPGSRVCIVTDSRLMLDSMTKWIAGWKRKGWKTAGGEPVKNQDLVQALDAELARHDPLALGPRARDGRGARPQVAQRPRRPPRGRRSTRGRLSAIPAPAPR